MEISKTKEAMDRRPEIKLSEAKVLSFVSLSILMIDVRNFEKSNIGVL